MHELVRPPARRPAWACQHFAEGCGALHKLFYGFWLLLSFDQTGFGSKAFKQRLGPSQRLAHTTFHARPLGRAGPRKSRGRRSGGAAASGRRPSCGPSFPTEGMLLDMARSTKQEPGGAKGIDNLSFSFCMSPGTPKPEDKTVRLYVKQRVEPNMLLSWFPGLPERFASLGHTSRSFQAVLESCTAI